jgi:hypothetical protein
VDAELCMFCKGTFAFPPCSLQDAPSFTTESPEAGMVSFVVVDTTPEKYCLCGCGTDVGVMGARGEVPGLVVDLGWFGRGTPAAGGLDGGGRTSSGSKSVTDDIAGLVS